MIVFVALVVAALATGEAWANPIIVGLVVGIPTTMLGIVGYRRAARLDKEAARAALIANRSDEVQRIIDGLDRLVSRLQVESEADRIEKAELTEQLLECRAAYAELRRVTSS